MGIVEGIAKYASGLTGVMTPQYLYIFLLSVNPAVFRMFKWQHYVFLSIGILISFINSRAVMPFLFLILLDLDYSKFDAVQQRYAFYFFLAGVSLVSLFGKVY